MTVFGKLSNLFICLYIYLFFFAVNLDLRFIINSLAYRESTAFILLLPPWRELLQGAYLEETFCWHLVDRWKKNHGVFTSNTLHQNASERQAGVLKSVFIRSLVGGETHLFHHGGRHKTILSEGSRGVNFLSSKTYKTITLLMKNKQKSYQLSEIWNNQRTSNALKC